jgi:hypothetical protein
MTTQVVLVKPGRPHNVLVRWMAVITLSDFSWTICLISYLVKVALLNLSAAPLRHRLQALKLAPGKVNAPPGNVNWSIASQPVKGPAAQNKPPSIIMQPLTFLHLISCQLRSCLRLERYKDIPCGKSYLLATLFISIAVIS